MRDWLTGGVVGFAGGVGFCAALGIVLALHAWKNREPDRVQIGAHQVAALAPVAAADLVRAAQSGSSAPSRTTPEKTSIEPVPAAKLAIADDTISVSEKSKAGAIGLIAGRA